jgi:hypothetical protein
VPITKEEREEREEGRAVRLRELEEHRENLRLGLTARFGSESVTRTASGRGFKVEQGALHCAVSCLNHGVGLRYPVQLIQNGDFLISNFGWWRKVFTSISLSEKGRD